MSLAGLMSLSISAILIENFVLVQFLGICPFIGVSKKSDTAVGMGIAVTFVMTLSSVFTYIVDRLILVPLNMEYLRTIAFILVIAAFVQFVEIVLHKLAPSLYKALGIYLPLITTNCAVLGVALINSGNGYNFIESVIYSASAGIGFLLAIVLFAFVRERLEFSDIPKSFEGVPIALITAALLSLAFMGFQGMKIL